MASDMFRMVRPCDKCPFRTDVPGYLSRGRAREIAAALLADQTFHCHATVDYSDSAETGEGRVDADSLHCAGATIVLERSGRPNQMMRICGRLGLYDPEKLDMAAPVVSSLRAFIAHHGEDERMTTTRTPAPPAGAYVLAPSELEEALRETVRMAAEYWRHDTTEKAARAAAAEMLGRLEGER